MSEPKLRPILMRDWTVRAILDGSKTETRRLVKPQPPALCIYAINGNQNAAVCYQPSATPVFVPPTAKSTDHLLPCPYGRPGDRLYVRECFTKLDAEHVIDSDYVYRADCTDDDDSERCRQDFIRCGYPYQWRPSIHMPKAAARIFLEIDEIRVERLHDIDAAGIRAEGIDCPLHDFAGGSCLGNCRELRGEWRTKWQQINGPQSWDKNPWLWVLTFHRIDKEAALA